MENVGNEKENVIKENNSFLNYLTGFGEKPAEQKPSVFFEEPDETSTLGVLGW